MSEYKVLKAGVNDYRLFVKDNKNYYIDLDFPKFTNLSDIEDYLQGRDFTVEYTELYKFPWGTVGPGNFTYINNLKLHRGSMKPDSDNQYCLDIIGNEGKTFSLWFDSYDKVESIYNKLTEVLRK